MVLSAVRDLVDETEVEDLLNFCLEKQLAWKTGSKVPFPRVVELFPDWQSARGAA